MRQPSAATAKQASIAQLVSKYQASKSASWRSRYLKELKDRKTEFINYFDSLPATEEQVLTDLYGIISGV